VVAVYLGPSWSLLEADGFGVDAGGGLDLRFVHLRQWNSLGSVARTDEGLAPGAHLRAGAWHALGAGALSLQLRFDYARLASVPGFSGQLGGASLGLGYRFPF
jgi:hypothetical protein